MGGFGRGARPGRARPRAMRLAAVLLLGHSVSGCATGLPLEAGRFRHPALGFSIDHPGETWRGVSVDGAALAFRGPEGASLSLLSRCTRADATPKVLAQRLLIGLQKRELIERGPIVVGGLAGWFQRLRARDGDAAGARQWAACGGALVPSGPRRAACPMARHRTAQRS